jgi:hypothetical protein
MQIHLNNRGTRTIHSNLSFVFQIALVGNYDDGEGIFVFYTQDLLIESADFFKRVPRRDGVDKKETLSGAHVLLTHSTVS